MAGSLRYEVRLRVRGRLEAGWWCGVFDGLHVAACHDGTTLLTGIVPDQSALHGLLGAVRDSGLTLLSLESVGMDGRHAPRGRG